MTWRRPPSLADFLMARFDVCAALIGDLHEQYQAGRSQRWYVWQTLGALAATTLTGLRQHPWQLIRPFVIGWGARVLLGIPAGSLGRIAQRHVTEWLITSGRYEWWAHRGFDSAWIAFFPAVIPGRIVQGIVCAFVGWLIIRTQQSDRAAALFLFAASILLLNIGVLLFPLIVGGFTPSTAAVWAANLASATAEPLAVLLGGIYANSERRMSAT